MEYSPFERDDVPLNPDYGARTGFLQSIAGGISSGLDNTSLALPGKLEPFLNSSHDSQMSQAQFNDYGYSALGLSWEPGMTFQSIQATLDAQRDRQQENQFLAHTTTGGYAGYLAGNLVGGLADPAVALPIGDAVEASSLGRAILRGSMANAALGVPTTAGNFYIGEKTGDPNALSNAVSGLAMQAGAGAVLGGLGYGAGRLLARMRGMDLGASVDRDGNVIPSAPLPSDEPINEPETIQESIAAADQPVPLRAKSQKVLTDEQFTNQFINPESPRANQLVTDPVTGERTLIDPVTGEILRDNPIARPETPISPENQDLVKQIEPQLQNVVFEGDNPAGVNLPKPSPLSQGSREARSAILDQALKERADQSVERPDRPSFEEQPEGVPQVRQSAGNETKIKEVPLQQYYRRSLRDRTIFSLDAKSFRAGNIRAEPMLQKMRVLTRDQWAWTVDHVAQKRMLSYLARNAEIATAPDITKRELGDLLFERMHDTPVLNQPKPAPRGFQETYQIPEDLDLNAEEIAARIREADGIKDRVTPDETLDVELGLSKLTPQNIAEELRKFSDAIPLEELAKQSPEVASILKEAQTIRRKKQALIDSILCLLDE